MFVFGFYKHLKISIGNPLKFSTDNSTSYRFLWVISSEVLFVCLLVTALSQENHKEGRANSPIAIPKTFL